MFTGQPRGLGDWRWPLGGGDETGVVEGTPWEERRDGREQGKGMIFVALAGGRCMFTKRAHSSVVRMAGPCAAKAPGQTGQMVPGRCSVQPHGNTGSGPTCCCAENNQSELQVFDLAMELEMTFAYAESMCAFFSDKRVVEYFLLWNRVTWSHTGSTGVQVWRCVLCGHF